MNGEKIVGVSGYVICSRCLSEPVVTPVAARTGGLCNACFVSTGGRTTLQVSHKGKSFEVKRSGAGKYKPRKLTPQRRERIKVRDRARLNAMRELAYRHPVEFSDILATERGKLGLDPWTIDAALAAQLAELGVQHDR